jgi:hypothetical protein
MKAHRDMIKLLAQTHSIMVNYSLFIMETLEKSFELLEMQPGEVLVVSFYFVCLGVSPHITLSIAKTSRISYIKMILDQDKFDGKNNRDRTIKGRRSTYGTSIRCKHTMGPLLFVFWTPSSDRTYDFPQNN